MNSSLDLLTAQGLAAQGIVATRASNGDFRVAARCDDVGDLVVSCENSEITVYVGDVTHCHFTPFAAYDNVPEYTETECAADAVQFVADVVNDKWIIWKVPGGASGCYRPDGDDYDAANAPLPGESVLRFVWSGPIAGA